MAEEQLSGCGVCNAEGSTHCLGYISIAIDEADDMCTSRTFCCWDHARVWVNSNEPPFWNSADQPKTTFFDLVLGVGCLLIGLLILIGLANGVAVVWRALFS